MTKDRTKYWREYARKNADKRKAIKAAYRERNKAKISASAKLYRAAHAIDADKNSDNETSNARPSAPRVVKPRISKPRIDETKAEAFESLRERFAAFRLARGGAS
jgi:hypothetical protein